MDEDEERRKKRRLDEDVVRKGRPKARDSSEHGD